VKKGDTLCLVEVMKMFNTIAAPDAGIIHCVVAVHGQPVAMDAILMIINPGTPE
jgi:biotin carboxyl carrier protein